MQDSRDETCASYGIGKLFLVERMYLLCVFTDTSAEAELLAQPDAFSL